MVQRQVAVSKKSDTSQNLSQAKHGLRPSSIAKPKQTKRSKNPQKLVESFYSWEESRKWEQQYWQGKGISDLQGMGCGCYLLGSSWIPSQSPIDGEMRFEVSSGLGKSGCGSIRLCAPKVSAFYAGRYAANFVGASCPRWYASTISDCAQSSYPAFHSQLTDHYRADHCASEPRPISSEDSNIYRHRHPSRCYWLIPIVQGRPEIISFNWPDKKPDEDLKGTVGEAADKETDTYLSVFKQVFDDQLAPFGKSVIDVSDEGTKDQTFNCSATLSYRIKNEDKEVSIQGHVYFLDKGMLFSSPAMKLYLPFESIVNAILVLARDKALYSDSPVSLEKEGRLASFEVHIKATEPFYKKGNKSKPNAHRNGQDPILLSFRNMPVELREKVKDYAWTHGIEIKECEQLYYDFAASLPMTGWNPL